MNFTDLPAVARHRLDNGLTVLTCEDHSARVVCSMMWYGVGSRDEQPGTRGISHFLEHMMFKGSRRFSKGEIDSLTTRHGGTNNAFTAQDYTAYYFCFASDRWETALEIEADRMRGNFFDDKEFELERQVILEELNMELDSPWGQLRRAVEDASFQSHPYRFPIIGLQPDLQDMTPDLMARHYHRFYVPSNAILVLAGDFATAAALESVERLFGSLPGLPAPYRPPCTEEPFRSTPLQIPVEGNGHVGRILAAFPAPSMREPQHYALHVLDKILSEGKLSRLYTALIDESGVVSWLSTEFADTWDRYLYLIWLEVLGRADPAQVSQALENELRRLAEHPPDPDELERAKTQCRFSFLSSIETPLDQALQLGLFETLGGFEYWLDYEQRISRVTEEDVAEMCRRFLSPEKAVVGICAHGFE